MVPGPLGVLLLVTPEPVCPQPLPASGLLTPRPWQFGSGWAICTHILKFSHSQLPLRQEVMACRACSDPVHTSHPYMEKPGSVFYLSPQIIF